VLKGDEYGSESGKRAELREVENVCGRVEHVVKEFILSAASGRAGCIL
jgi:hypothetical protein